MLLRLRKTATEPERTAVLALAAELGYEASFLDAGKRVLELQARRESRVPRAAHRSLLEDRSCVEGVLDAGDAPELSERNGRRDSTVRVGPLTLGAGHVALAAGPCAVESEARLLEIASGVRQAGAVLLRGGAYKPRTSPYSFQGLGPRALEMLARVRERTGLAIVTEVLDPRDVPRVAEVADMLQIGSRSMANGPLLVEAARSGKPILLKRGLAARGREFLLAAETILAQGNEQVVLCERGVRGFDDATRNVLDLGFLAWLKGATHLPVFVDPSHAAGRRELVLPLAKAALAAGADGLIVEVHPAPAEVRSDGAQAIDLATFAEIARFARALAHLEGRVLAAPPEPREAAREGAR